MKEYYLEVNGLWFFINSFLEVESPKSKGGRADMNGESEEECVEGAIRRWGDGAIKRGGDVKNRNFSGANLHERVRSDLQFPIYERFCLSCFYKAVFLKYFI